MSDVRNAIKKMAEDNHRHVKQTFRSLRNYAGKVLENDSEDLEAVLDALEFAEGSLEYKYKELASRDN